MRIGRDGHASGMSRVEHDLIEQARIGQIDIG